MMLHWTWTSENSCLSTTSGDECTVLNLKRITHAPRSVKFEKEALDEELLGLLVRSKERGATGLMRVLSFLSRHSISVFVGCTWFMITEVCGLCGSSKSSYTQRMSLHPQSSCHEEYTYSSLQMMVFPTLIDSFRKRRWGLNFNKLL